MRHHLFFALLAVAIALAGAHTRAATMPAVVELFTSQGCSSCPPADELLGELAQRPDVIALAYHVDYWDHLGWTDRFSLADATARQQAYGHAMALSTVYTPQMVVDGSKDLVGSDRSRVLAALKGQRDGIVPALAVEGGNLHVTLSPADGAAGSEITLVAYTREAQTRVARGENAGRSLREWGIVRAVKRLGAWDGAARQLSVDLAALPADCSNVALLIQRSGNGPMIGAASTSLR